MAESEYDQFKQIKIKNIITVSSRYFKSLKKEINRKLTDSLFIWDSNVKGVMLKYLNLKLENKLVELIETQESLNIPVIYEAVYFIPKEDEFLNGEVVEITEKLIKIELFGFLNGYVDLDPINESINVHMSSSGNSISILSNKGQTIKIGDLILVKILKHFVRIDKSLVLACQLDLNNLSIISK